MLWLKVLFVIVPLMFVLPILANAGSRLVDCVFEKYDGDPRYTRQSMVENAAHFAIALWIVAVIVLAGLLVVKDHYAAM